MKNKFSIFIVLFFLSFTDSIITAQQPIDPAQVISLDKISNDGKRAEIQRYFGYENLLCGYTTLPYDISMSTNQQGRFVDVGFALFIILPLIVLAYFFGRNLRFYTFLIALIFYLSLCFSFSYLFDQNRNAYRPQLETWDAFSNSENHSWTIDVLTNVYSSAYWLSKPLVELSESISGATDRVTYPIYFFILVFGLLLIGRSSFSSELKILLFLFHSYFTLWLLLSGGIVWYGFLIIPLGLCLILYFLKYISNDKSTHSTFIRWGIQFTLFFWLFLSIVVRVSNINVLQLEDKKSIGKGIVDGNLLYYASGISTSKQARDNSYQHIGDALERINSNDDLIFMVGTSFTFEIKNNTKRIYADNVLTIFFSLFDKYRDKEVIIDVLKASKVRYIIVDLYTHTLDKTPERSLENKFKLLLNSLYSNPKIKLLATDRIVSNQDEYGNTINSLEVFGSKIVQYGSYAIYEIL